MGTLELLTKQPDGTYLDPVTGCIVKQGFAAYLQANDPDIGHVLSNEIEFPSQPGNPNIGQCSLQFGEKGILLYLAEADTKDGIAANSVLLAYAGQVAFALYQQLQAAQNTQTTTSAASAQEVQALDAQIATLKAQLAAAPSASTTTSLQATIAQLQQQLKDAWASAQAAKVAQATSVQQLQDAQKTSDALATANRGLTAALATAKDQLAAAQSQSVTPPAAPSLWQKFLTFFHL